jgi:plastocyanin
MKIKKSQFNFLIGILVAIPVLFIIIASTATSTSSSAIDVSTLSTNISMIVLPTDYSPNRFVIPVGKEVTWKITNNGATGCTQALIARGLINGYVDLGKKGDTKVVTIKAEKPGKYNFSCSMGMVTGVIEAV